VGESVGNGAATRSERHSYTPLELFFLGRLERFLRLRRQHRMNELPPELVKLLDKAILSTYRDCLQLGIGEEARRILRRELGQSSTSSGYSQS